MPRFFVRSTQIVQNTVTVTGEDARHISRSLRMAPGEEITVCDESGKVYKCLLSGFTENTVTARIVAEMEEGPEPPCRIWLYQALPKGDKMDTVIQKAVESGVFAVVPFESERCIVRAKKEAEAHKTERRRRIALEAAKQCGRAIVPEVTSTIAFSEMLCHAAEADLTLFCYEGEGTVSIGKLLQMPNIRAVGSIALVIGSEGGFSDKEANAAREKGFLMTGLGRRILRTETASGFALACISCVTELS